MYIHLYHVRITLGAKLKAWNPMARLTSRVLGVIWLALGITAAADEAANREALRVEVEQLRDSGRLSIGGVDIASGDLLAELYERRNFTPTWTDVEQIDELIVAVQAMYDDGLDPSDYHADEIEFVKRELEAGRIVTPRERAALDIMLTDSVIRLGYHQRFGKVNPVDLDPVWNFDRDLNGRDPATVLQEAIDAESLTRFLAELFPRGPLYMALRDALGKYRRIAADGGWPQTPDGANTQTRRGRCSCGYARTSLSRDRRLGGRIGREYNVVQQYDRSRDTGISGTPRVGR